MSAGSGAGGSVVASCVVPSDLDPQTLYAAMARSMTDARPEWQRLARRLVFAPRRSAAEFRAPPTREVEEFHYELANRPRRASAPSGHPRAEEIPMFRLPSHLSRSHRLGRGPLAGVAGLALLAAIGAPPRTATQQSTRADRSVLLSEAIGIRLRVLADSALIDGCSVYRVLDRTANYVELLDQRVRDRIEVRGPEPCSPLPPKRRSAPIAEVRALVMDSDTGYVDFAVDRGAIAYVERHRFVATSRNTTLNVTAIGSRWRLRDILISNYLIR